MLLKEQQHVAPSTRPILDEADLAKSLDDADKALSSLRSPGGGTLKGTEAIDSTTEGAKSAYELLEPILEKVKIFASIMEDIGDVRQPLVSKN